MGYWFSVQSGSVVSLHLGPGMTEKTSQSELPYPCRFGWGMRLFLVLFLFDMIYRAGFWTAGEFGVPLDDLRVAPLALPSQSELASIDAGTHPDGYTTRSSRYMASLHSAVEFMTPKPEKPIESLGDFGVFSSRWLMSRLVFVAHITGNDQTWQMFSNVPGTRLLMHVTLIYEDGSSRPFFGWSHPEDYTQMAHWFEEKRLQMELNALYIDDCRYGYCNWLSHQHGKNAAGSPLKTIELSTFRFYRTEIGADSRVNLELQNTRPVKQRGPVFWRYDVKTKIAKQVAEDP